MDLDRSICSRARLSRDARFDGRFFIGVKSTRIYCRPICPVRTVKEENVRYFSTAAAATEAGFRPCLRCRPELCDAAHARIWYGAARRSGGQYFRFAGWLRPKLEADPFWLTY